jgi:hypothetical protein
MRVAEILTDFRTTSHRVNALAIDPPPNDRTVGWLVMAQCKAEMRALLARPFNSGPNLQVPGGDAEQIKGQLRR